MPSSKKQGFLLFTYPEIKQAAATKMLSLQGKRGHVARGTGIPERDWTTWDTGRDVPGLLPSVHEFLDHERGCG